MRDLVYASDGYTTHDRRFLAAAASDGRRVHFVRFDGGQRVLDDRPLPAGVVETSWLGSSVSLSETRRAEFGAAFRSLVVDLEVDLVHAGPVPTVGEVCVVSSPVPVVVMSWASDLLIDARADRMVGDRARTALTGAAEVLVDNGAVARAAIAFGADSRRVHTIPWGVDLDEFPRRALPSRVGPLRLLSLRSFEWIYDIATALRALALVGPDQATLTLAGSGSLETELRTLAAELGVAARVTWLGRVDEGRIGGLLAEHDVHLSTAVSDGTSISLLQAMATGRPSIVTDIAPNRDWVTEGVNGWLFPPGDSRALASSITGITDATPTLEAAASAARSVAETRADWRINRRRILDIYDSIGATSWI